MANSKAEGVNDFAVGFGNILKNFECKRMVGGETDRCVERYLYDRIVGYELRFGCSFIDTKCAKKFHYKIYMMRASSLVLPT